MKFEKTVLLSVLVLITACAGVSVHPGPDERSVLVASLKGTLRVPPRSFIGNSPSIGGDRGSVEFKGFRVVNRDEERSYIVRPRGDSYFHQELPPGDYELARRRLDRPSYKEERYITILTFTVPERSLVNLGTIEISLVKPPEEKYLRLSTRARGQYTYLYRYLRPEGNEAMAAPLEWFTRTRPGTAAQYTGRIVEITGRPTDTVDSSKFTLKEGWYPLLSPLED